MPRIPPKDWRPSGIDDLEPAAWNALRHEGSASVVAGPGSGKTEFLAQRAVYLLQTGICPPPRRVLAISFKSDAADNLGARVRQRCPPELASRFVSQTFDAFTKSLVDHFHPAIPSAWRPTQPYQVDFPTRRTVEDFLVATRANAPTTLQSEIATLNASDFEPRHVGAHRLPLTSMEPHTGIEFAIQRWWSRRLPSGLPSALTFVCINRLAELLLRANPSILRALRATYSFVFVDEFQDTTYAQYDFLLTALANSHIAITAVGDDKQRIMVWAGARPDVFARFEEGFAARRFELQFNFRSSPDLVRIQQVVAHAIDPRTAPTVSRTTRQVDGDVAQVWNSATRAGEAQYLANWIARDMANRNRSPRDYALLVRQKADDYEAEFTPALAIVGLRIRNESHYLGRAMLQDLLADELGRIAIALMKLGATRRAPEAWALASASIERLREIDPDDEPALHKAHAELETFIAKLRALMAASPPSAEAAQALAKCVFEFIDLAAVSRAYLQYGTGDLLAIMVEAFGLHWIACSKNCASWSAAIDAFEGLSQIPLLTVHKSKGLEYDTVLFIGLDDQAWWSHVPGNPEGLSTFFVALSRAKQRALFTFCQARGQRKKVAELYQLLTNAGVPEIAT